MQSVYHVQRSLISSKYNTLITQGNDIFNLVRKAALFPLPLQDLLISNQQYIPFKSLIKLLIIATIDKKNAKSILVFKIIHYSSILVWCEATMVPLSILSFFHYYYAIYLSINTVASMMLKSYNSQFPLKKHVQHF